MRNSDMVILIIGGEYGSAASGETKDKFKEYMSVTRNEFRTAIESGIPIFVMIDKKVMSEYGVYEANYNNIENEDIKIKFVSTKNINVFRFIKEIKGIVTLSIQEFEKSTDIKDFISKQWADMFKNYLRLLRNKENEKKTLIRKTDIILDSIEKNEFPQKSSEEHMSIANILDICNLIGETFNFIHLEENIRMGKFGCRENFLNSLLETFKVEAYFSQSILDISSMQIALAKTLSRETKQFIEVSEINIKKFYELKKFRNIIANDENVEKIVYILSQDEYFLKMLYCGSDY